MLNDGIPDKILVETPDGYIVALLQYLDQLENHSTKYVYKQTAYYHTLKEAIQEEFGE